MPKSSEVWESFSKKDNNIADCKLCGKQIKTGGGTTNLKNHLLHKHPSNCQTIPNKKQKLNTFEIENAIVSTISSVTSPEASTSTISKRTNLKRDASSNGSILISEAKDEHAYAHQTKTRNRLSAISSVEESSFNNYNENEFDYFCKSIAIQLKNMPLDRALICQEKLQRVMTTERMDQYRNNSSLENLSYEEGIQISIPVTPYIEETNMPN